MRDIVRSFVVMVLVFCVGGIACSKEESAPAEEKTSEVETNDPEPAQKQEARPAIVFLGDSLTAGLGLPEEQALPALIESKIDAQGGRYTVINAGRSGDTTAGGLARLDWYLKDSVNPKVLVIFLGSNDAIRGTAPSTIFENLQSIIKKARAYRPEMKIFLCELKTFPNMGADYGAPFQELFVTTAREQKVELISFPLQNVAGRPDLNQSDGVHPNQEGTRLVAAHVWQALEPHLKF